MIKAEVHGTKEKFRASLRMMFTLRDRLMFIVYIALTVVCFLVCAGFLRNAFRNKYDMFSAVPAVYIFCSAACLVVGIRMILRTVSLIRGWAAVKRKDLLMHKSLTFEEDGYTVSYNEENGVSFEGRYSYPAVEKLVTYRDFICIVSPDDNTTFSISDITEGTAGQLTALLDEKLAGRIIHK